MPRFITHDALSGNLFNTQHCTATGVFLPWKAELTNSPALLRLLINRLEKDWCALPVKQRRPWNQKDVESQFNVRVYSWGPDSPCQLLGSCRASMVNARIFH